MPTPFGIRRRLKALFGIQSGPVAAKEEPPKATLIVVGPDGAEQTTEAFIGTSITSASTRFRKPIATGCAESSCGTCRVEIIEGGENLTDQSARERATLKENNFATTLRLGCRAELVKGTVKVKAFELM